ncbi:putative receptor-like protein kinase [Cucumis melo var. makuwa]|uniref:Receptor-like protein kinase n=1 Tax=Cucumis melo var. makuwa TaxID=1194695 RepID=A0A5D3DM21_CUCMM|nr:putative receptor-like protein kinase [Cucumis melo var. makuwa]TYK24320.1 putative receptor-like protein kinase [Cucumis melo var. makuwa]
MLCHMISSLSLSISSISYQSHFQPSLLWRIVTAHTVVVVPRAQPPLRLSLLCSFVVLVPYVKLRPTMAMVVDMLEGRVAVEEPPGTEVLIVDLLSIDEEMMNSDEKLKIVPFKERMDDRNVPSSSSTSCSYVFSILSAR